ncbi:MAG: uridine phosphorylase [Acidaminococcales bacterium]|jgi:uridine phosphorylase|nr:uridine phosphorylase [Acidaminococcales bacterium]
MPNYAQEDEVLYHTGLSRRMLENARCVLLPGDPGRVESIAGVFVRPRFLTARREYTSWLAYCRNKPLLVCSTGMGGPSVTICVEELARLGVKNFIRVGTSGSIQQRVKLGDVVINNAAVRLDGASGHYAPYEFPAAADFELTGALVKSARRAAVPCHVGIAVSSDTFWPGQERYDSFTGYVLPSLRGSLAVWRQLGALNCEMETAALFVSVQALGLSAACICGIVAARADSEAVAGRDVYELALRRVYAVLREFFADTEAL